MTEIRLTPEAAKTIVSSGTPLRTKSVQTVPRIVDSPVEQPTGGGETIELAYLRSAPYTSDGKTISDAYLCNEAGNKDTNQPITIVWSGVLSTDRNAFLTGRYIWVTKRNDEWVALSQTTAHNTYTAGDGIIISSNVITNNGVMKSAILNKQGAIVNMSNQAASSEANRYYDRDILYFYRWFKWVSVFDTVGKRELSLKTATKQVVTGVTQDAQGNLNVTTEEIICLSDS